MLCYDCDRRCVIVHRHGQFQLKVGGWGLSPPPLERGGLLCLEVQKKWHFDRLNQLAPQLCSKASTVRTRTWGRFYFLILIIRHGRLIIIQECHSVVKIPSLTTTQSGSAWVMWKLDDDQSLPWMFPITPSQTLSAILGAPGGYSGFYSLCGVKGNNRVTQAPLGWYSTFIFSSRWDIYCS